MDLLTKKILFCEACGYKQLVNENELNLVPRMDIQNGTKDLNKKKLKQNMMSKCPKCGRGVILKRLTEAYLKNENRKTEDKAN